MQMRKAARRAAKLRIGFSAVAGGGKTYSALLVAYGFTKDWNKICVIDTENGSADLYSHLGEYNVIPLTDFSPDTYIKAIKACEKAGMEVIIVDSITHEWEWCLERVSSMGGNKFNDGWGTVTPLHNSFKNAILQSTCHVFTTVRRATDYQMITENGKTKILKGGLKEKTRDGWEYEITTNFEIDQTHFATAAKDRTGLFGSDFIEILSSETGEKLLEWSIGEGGSIESVFQIALVEINNSSKSQELKLIFSKFPELQEYKPFKDALNEKLEVLKTSIVNS